MIPSDLNHKFLQFQQLTDRFVESKTNEKTVAIAKAWTDFLQNNQSTLLYALQQPQAASLLQKVEQINITWADFSQFPGEQGAKVKEAVNLLLADEYPFPLDLLPLDLLRKVMSFLTFQELMQVGGAARNLRSRVLDIQTWRSNRMFQKLLQSGKRAGMQARNEFAQALRGYQNQALAPALAMEFTKRANHDDWRFFLEEIDRDGRDILYTLLKDQDLNDLSFLYLPGYNWLDKDRLNFEFFLNKCPNLNGLHVGGGQTFLTDSILIGIAARYPELTHFNCEGSSLVTGSYLNSWPVTKITTLVLGGSPKFQAGYLAANVDKFPELTKLQLFNLRLKDEDLTPLTKLKKLEELDISANPNLTDATLALLAQLPSLQKIHLKGIKDISPAGIRTLREARPSLKIVY